MEQAQRVSDKKVFLNAEELWRFRRSKVGYLTEYGSTSKMFNSPKEKTIQKYISGKSG